MKTEMNNDKTIDFIEEEVAVEYLGVLLHRQILAAAARKKHARREARKACTELMFHACEMFAWRREVDTSEHEDNIALEIKGYIEVNMLDVGDLHDLDGFTCCEAIRCALGMAKRLVERSNHA